jgi:DNA-binding transcriptional ArsR family regulator
MISTLSALAEPNRLAIVGLLRDGPRPVGAIVDRLRLSQPLVSRHLRVLADAGIVAVEPRAQQRIYRLDERPFREIEHWLASYTAIWDDRLDRLEHHLREGS